MIAARRKEREYFETSPEYGHLSSKMGAEYLAKLLSKVFLSILSSYNVPYFITNVVPFGALTFESRLKLIFLLCTPFPVYFFACFLILAFRDSYQTADTKYHCSNKQDY